MRVADLILAEVPTCSPDEILQVAVGRMLAFACDCLPVTVCDGPARRVVGVLTPSAIPIRSGTGAPDLARARMTVGERMHFPVHTVRPQDTLATCASRFAAAGSSHLVVTDDGGRCLGVITRDQVERASAQAATTVPAAQASSH
jgi:CBS domain-containing protein